MPVVRVYVPIGRSGLHVLADSRALRATPGSPLAAYAVTPALTAGTPGADVEELEYAAFSDAVAAATSLRERPGDRRVVVAADADPAWLAERPQGSAKEWARGEFAGSRVALVAGLPLERVASLHVDEHSCPAALGTADGRPGPEDLGAPGAPAAPGDLLWYDVTELSEVRRLLG